MQAYSGHWELIQQVLRDHINRGDLRYTEHANERMEERGISRKTVEYIVYRNRPTEMHVPFKYPYGEYRRRAVFSLHAERHSAGSGGHDN